MAGSHASIHPTITPAALTATDTTGSGGMLGRDVHSRLADGQVTALDRAALDITDPEAVRAAVADMMW